MTPPETEVRAGVLEKIPQVSESHDTTEILKRAISREENPSLDEIDLLVVASTVVSKCEGEKLHLSELDVSHRAHRVQDEIEKDTGEDRDPRFIEAVLRESSELLISSPFLLSVTHFGHVAPNAGIDRSNIEGEETVLLLPSDPSESAHRISQELDIPVVVSDTCGRPFRKGQRGVAIGWSGFAAIEDWSGRKDLNGYELEATEEAVADEAAAFANLLMGEGDDGTPATYFRDIQHLIPSDGRDELFRDREDDLIRDALDGWKFK